MTYGCTCGGHYRVETARTTKQHRLRYLVCKACGGRTSVSVKLDAEGKELPCIVLSPRTQTISLPRHEGTIEP